MTIAGELDMLLKRVLPERREHQLTEPESHALALHVTRLRAAAEELTRREVFDLADLRSELRAAATHLASGKGDLYVIRHALERARDAAGAPDPWARRLVDRFFGP